MTQRFTPYDQALHIVALSGGKDSSALALRLVETEPRDYIFICTPTGNEPPEMFEHWRKLGGLLGKPIRPVMGGTLEGLIKKQNAIPNWRQRWCTRMLKIEPYAAFLMQMTRTHSRIISHVGLRADEPGREGGDYLEVPGVEMVFDLRRWGWGLDEVITYNNQRGVVIPKRTDCMACFWQRLIEWWELWHDNLPAYMEAESWEDLTGHTFRSEGRDTWPASLKLLRARFEAGDKPKETRKDPGVCRVCRI